MEKITDMISSPTISDNLWKVMVEKQSEFSDLKILEFGSGGSTLGFIKEYYGNRHRYGSIKIVSFEHWPAFYRHLCRILPDYIEARDGEGLKFSVYRIKGPREGLSGRLKKNRLSKLYAVPPVYDILGTKKGVVFHPVRLTVMAIDLLNKRICALLSVVNSLSAYYFRKITGRDAAKWEKSLVLADMSPKGFKEYLEDKAISGKCMVEIKSADGSFRFDYYLLPEKGRNPFWRRMDIDGTFGEFEDYVLFPLDCKFDIVYLDGRSRVSCARRVLAEGLLSSGGYMFMHDAHKAWYEKWLQDVYEKGERLSGSNRRLDGRAIYTKPSGEALPSAKDELYVFKNSSGYHAG